MHTCYAPVRHSPPSIATCAAVRLACIKPAASVHPEPGSNSPLFRKFNTVNLVQIYLTHSFVVFSTFTRKVIAGYSLACLSLSILSKNLIVVLYF